MLEKQISVVIPCFNEGKTIFQNIKKINAYLTAENFSFEIIAVNDGSSDNTLAEIEKAHKEIGIKIINTRRNEGKGRTVRDGMMAAQKENVMFLDADLAIPVEELEKFLEEIEKGADIVIASRFVPGLKLLSPVLWYRRIMEQVFRFLRIIILNDRKVKDAQCGFKVFRGAVARRIFPMLTVDRFAFDSEIVFIAKKFGYAIRELPITLQNPPHSSVRIFRDPLNMFFALLKICWNDLTGKYQWKKKSEKK